VSELFLDLETAGYKLNRFLPALTAFNDLKSSFVLQSIFQREFSLRYLAPKFIRLRRDVFAVRAFKGCSLKDRLLHLPGRHADNGVAILHVVQDDGAHADFCVIADADSVSDVAACAEQNGVADGDFARNIDTGHDR
jgi:hypothetical protein